MFGSKITRAVAVVAISLGTVVGAALPSAAAPATTLSTYVVVEYANVHTDPSHTSRVIKIKQPGDVVTSPLPLCDGLLDPDGVTIWIEVNLGSGGIAWMGNGQLSPFCF